jgi:hypothetical protein
MWSVLLWSAGGLSVKSYETFDGAEFEALAAAAQILLFFCLVPAQLALLEYVGIDWREALRCYRGYVKDGKSFKEQPPPRSSTPTLHGPCCDRGYVVSVGSTLSVWLTPTIAGFLITTVAFSEIAPVDLEEGSALEQLLLPGVVALSLFVVLCPYPLLRPERAWFCSAFGSALACLSGWSWLSPTFESTFIADALTSSSLLLWNVETSLCFYIRAAPFADFEGLNVTTAHVEQISLESECAGKTWNQRVLKPLVAASPFAIRFVQCYTALIRAVTEELRAQCSSGADERGRGARRVSWRDSFGTTMTVVTRERGRCAGLCAWRVAKHALNALKYSTALLLILVASLKNEYTAGAPVFTTWWGVAWLCAVLLKTSYCAVWDVVCDWAIVTIDWTHCFEDFNCVRGAMVKRRGLDASLIDGSLSSRDLARERMFHSSLSQPALHRAFDAPHGAQCDSASCAPAAAAAAASAAQSQHDAARLGSPQAVEARDSLFCRKGGKRPHCLCFTLRIFDVERNFPWPVYAVAAVLNLCARFAWAIVLGPYQVPLLNSRLVFAAVEIVRRLGWGVLRIENEALGLARKARAAERLNELMVASAASREPGDHDAASDGAGESDGGWTTSFRSALPRDVSILGSTAATAPRRQCPSDAALPIPIRLAAGAHLVAFDDGEAVDAEPSWNRGGGFSSFASMDELIPASAPGSHGRRDESYGDGV